MPASWTFRAAALLGLLGVAMGAFGAHALKPTLAAFNTADLWQTAVFYQLVHALALLALAIADRASRLLTVLWLAGLLCFSGSLYLLAVTELKAYLWPVTPLGGLLLMAGWLLLILRGR